MIAVSRPSGTTTYDPTDTPVPATLTALAPLTIMSSVGTHPGIGETTDLPGLVITPAAGGHPLRYTGRWRLTHAGSGYAITPTVSLVHAREAVLWLAGKGIDWTRPGHELTADPHAKAVHADLYAELIEARQWSTPLLWTRESWVPHPPLWRVWADGAPTDVAYRRWYSVEIIAAYAADCPPEPWLRPDSQIRRDSDSPGWTLRCAAPLCADGFTVWFGEVDGGVDTAEYGHRRDLALTARDDGWTRHGRFWMCPDCTTDHRQKEAH